MLSRPRTQGDVKAEWMLTPPQQAHPELQQVRNWWTKLIIKSRGHFKSVFNFLSFFFFCNIPANIIGSICKLHLYLPLEQSAHHPPDQFPLAWKRLQAGSGSLELVCPYGASSSDVPFLLPAPLPSAALQGTLALGLAGSKAVVKLHLSKTHHPWKDWHFKLVWIEQYALRGHIKSTV